MSALLTTFWMAVTNLPLVLPLVLACGAVAVFIPASAFKGRLHIPGYVGIAFLTFLLAMLVGKLSGARSIAGTRSGIVLSLLFFVLVAAAVGSVLALFFYRDSSET
jgi:hypothetical protein